MVTGKLTDQGGDEGRNVLAGRVLGEAAIQHLRNYQSPLAALGYSPPSNEHFERKLGSFEVQLVGHEAGLPSVTATHAPQPEAN